MTLQYEVPIGTYHEIPIILRAIGNHFVDRIVRRRGLVARPQIRLLAKVTLHHRIHQRIVEDLLAGDQGPIFREFEAVFRVTDLVGRGFTICADPTTDPPGGSAV